MSASPQYHWHKIAESMEAIGFGSNGLARIEAGGKTICIGKRDDGLHACTDKCPHAGGIMADGYMDATGNIVCPIHRYKFNFSNGRNTSGEGYYLKTYPVELREDGVYVGLPSQKLL